MKNSRLALLLAVGIASIPQPIAAFPFKIIFDSALLLASIVSTVDLRSDYQTRKNRNNSHWNNRKYAQVSITAWIYFYTISELYKSYQKSKKEQESITVKTVQTQN